MDCIFQVQNLLEVIIMKNDYEHSQTELDAHANDCNPNNDAYWQSRDYDERPDNWKELIEDDD